MVAYNNICKMDDLQTPFGIGNFCRAQNEDWKLVSYSTVYCYRVSLASPLEMYSKFVLPNYTVLYREMGQKITNGRALY